uniref:Vacuolar protein sorting-associated protein n=1 Tax=Bursaphelenchus xylophilus TaxID=6326 RepID=A0A1I7RPG8_BURXY
MFRSFLHSTTSSESPESTDFLIVEKMTVWWNRPQLYSSLNGLPTGTLMNKSLKELEINLKLVLYDVVPEGAVSRLKDNYAGLQKLTLRIQSAIDNSTEVWERPGPIQLLFNEIHYLIRHDVQVDLILHVPIEEIYEENNPCEEVLVHYVKLLIPHFSANAQFAAHGTRSDQSSVYFNVESTNLKAHICVGEESCPLLKIVDTVCMF